MSHVAFWIHTPLTQALGRTLAHFIWEGALLAALLLLPTRRRYALACLTLAAMPVAFAVTLALVWAPQPAAIAVPLHWTAAPASAIPIAVSGPQFSWTMALGSLSWLVPVWFAGVAFCYARGLAGWLAVQRLRRRGVCAPPPEWQARLDQLADRLHISRPVALLESCLTDTPVLIGYLRPAVLLPLGCLTGLSTAQVECILLHELAHVARQDYLVNLLQSVVEGLLFYHPAVWWVSRVVRSERENCCDDRVVELMGSARVYAATLAMLEQRRALAPALAPALAASGGNLMKRIRRLTAESGSTPTSPAPAISAGVLLVMFAAALAAVPANTPRFRHVAPSAPVPLAVPMAAPAQASTPYQTWLNEDVAYIITDEERAAFSKLAADVEREQFINDFWEHRGGPLKAEHYRRIAYANEHFATSADPGWKTDRGRTYITYGPPDEIEDHSSGGSYLRPAAEGGGETSTVPFQDWRYRYLEGIGSNVEIEFVDPTMSGEFHLTMDPAEKDALLASNEKPRQVTNSAGTHVAVPPSPDEEQRRQHLMQTLVRLRQALAAPYKVWLNEDVAYIITAEERSAYLRLQTDDEREQFIRSFWIQRGDSMKAEHYRRIAYANQQFAARIAGWKTDRGHIYILCGPPDNVSRPAPDTLTWTYRNGESFQFRDPGNGDYQLISSPKQEAAANVLASNGSPGVSVMVAGEGVIAPGDVLEVAYAPMAGRDIAAKQSECAALRIRYTAAFPAVVECTRQLQSLEAASPTLASLENQLQAVETQLQVSLAQSKNQTQATSDVLREYQQKLVATSSFLTNLREESQSQLANPQRQQVRTIVSSDGRITLDNTYVFLAVGLTPEQLAANIGPGATVRVDQSADRMVIVMAPLANARDNFHVFAQITRNQKIVQAFEREASGQAALATRVFLRPGSYHLTVSVKDVASGETTNSATDFTVE